MKYNKMVIGIDQSYARTGICVMESTSGILNTVSLDYKGCKCNSEKRRMLRNTLEEYLNTYTDLGYNITVIHERIRLKSQGFINMDYIKSTGALVATIIDTCRLYDVKTYSVDTRSWKAQIVGSSKPLNNQYGINPEKYRTILYLRDTGFLRYIAEEYKGRGKKGVLNVKIRGERVPCKINDDVADAICIAKYGFLPGNKQNLKEENF